MTFVLVDNHDSFAWNLAHSLAAASGELPVVVLNDDPGGVERVQALAAAGALEGLVVSPGPGRPDVDRDVGTSRWAVAQESVPLLGVCLGHQGLCLAAGARVDLAPEPVHGRTSAVHHTGDELFDGVASPFVAMRYHSLVVHDPAPEELEVLARSEDGAVMAVRHRHRPHWGVQFHPESVATGVGDRIVANWVAAARRHQHGGGPQPAGTRAPARPAGAAAPPRGEPSVRRYRLVVREVLAPDDRPAAFAALFEDEPFAFWLDSARTAPPLSRSSMMGCASAVLGEVVSYDAGAGVVTVDEVRRPGATVHHGDVVSYLDSEVVARRVPPHGLTVDPSLGWVGYLGYEAVAATPGTPSRHRPEEPDACLLFADRGLVWDHETGRAHLLALTTPDDTRNLEWLDEAADRLAAAVTLPAPPLPEVWERPHVTARHDDEHYLALVEECQRQIRLGESYQVCLTNVLDVDCRVDGWQTYRRLRSVNPAPFASYLRFGTGLQVLSSSPERFLRVGRDGVAESRPIKGTAARSADQAADLRAAHRLATSTKERAENLIVVDLVRNDLGHSARTGSVHVPDLCRVETLETVHQLVSTVRATLRPDVSALECVRHAFPGGSMTGAPKQRTMEIIEHLEAGPRGVYAGAIGYVSLDGAVDLSITIRTVVLHGDRVSLGVGGGITALSDPAAELRETWLKAGALLDTLGQEVAAEGASRTVPA